MALRPDDQEANRKSGVAYAAALTLFFSVAALTGVGWLLDRWLGTRPWLLVAGLLLCAVAGFYEFIRLTSKLYAQPYCYLDNCAISRVKSLALPMKEIPDNISAGAFAANDDGGLEVRIRRVMVASVVLTVSVSAL